MSVMIDSKFMRGCSHFRSWSWLRSKTA